MKPTPIKSGRARLLLLSSLAVGAAIAVYSAADLPWTYDTSQRVEPTPSSEASVSCVLDAKAMDEELSSGCNLSSLPLGFFIIVQ